VPRLHVLPLQRIEISGQRTFQQASSEPLGEDWQAELNQLRSTRASAAAAIKTAQTNADPAVAQLRSDAAYVQRTVAALPPGDARDTLLDMSAELRREAEAAAAAAGLQPTEVRAGKQQRRADLRAPGDRKIKPLLPRQKGTGSTLRQRRVTQQQQAAPEDRCDPLPKIGSRSRQDVKVGLPAGVGWGRSSRIANLPHQASIGWQPTCTLSARSPMSCTVEARRDDQGQPAGHRHSQWGPTLASALKAAEAAVSAVTRRQRRQVRCSRGLHSCTAFNR